MSPRRRLFTIRRSIGSRYVEAGEGDLWCWWEGAVLAELIRVIFSSIESLHPHTSVHMFFLQKFRSQFGFILKVTVYTHVASAPIVHELEIDWFEVHQDALLSAPTPNPSRGDMF